MLQKSQQGFEDETIIETWNGIYPKLTDGRNYLLLKPESGVTIINGFGGAGMTLGFGFCEQLFTKEKPESQCVNKKEH